MTDWQANALFSAAKDWGSLSISRWQHKDTKEIMVLHVNGTYDIRLTGLDNNGSPTTELYVCDNLHFINKMREMGWVQIQ